MTAPAIDRAIGLCMRQGFTARAALEAYNLVSECALGSAIAVIRDERSRREGSPFDLEVRTLIARGEHLPHLQRVLTEDAAGTGASEGGASTGASEDAASTMAGAVAPPSDAARFRRQIITVLAGIAVQRGESWNQIQALLPAAADG